MEKVNLVVDEFCSPDSLFESPANELKRDFINNLLTREWRWSETDLDDIFKKSAQSVYQLSIENGSEDISEINGSHKYLETLARIASKKRYKLDGL